MTLDGPYVHPVGLRATPGPLGPAAPRRPGSALGLSLGFGTRKHDRDTDPTCAPATASEDVRRGQGREVAGRCRSSVSGIAFLGRFCKVERVLLRRRAGSRLWVELGEPRAALGELAFPGATSGPHILHLPVPSRRGLSGGANFCNPSGC